MRTIHIAVLVTVVPLDPLTHGLTFATHSFLEKGLLN
jgi:hypothetical protein